MAEESQSLQADPTVKGYSSFFHGMALWYDGQYGKAIEQWTVPVGVCGPAHALCKEPAFEHVEYLRLMAQAGINFDSFDEQGYSALDYAYLTDSHDARQMVQVILESLRGQQHREISIRVPLITESQIKKRIEDIMKEKIHQANLRRQYRKILQEHIRPHLRQGKADSISSLRSICAELVSDDESAIVFDTFDYVRYDTFKAHGRLTKFDEEKSQRFVTDQVSVKADRDKDHIVFISYRWIGPVSEPRVEGPDSADHIQFHRIIDAMELYLMEKKSIKRGRIGIWLDIACIDQHRPPRKLRGIDSLPLAVLQCNAMISLVDGEYWNRAWCAVEVALMRELVNSYQVHELWEHRLPSSDCDRVQGDLSRPKADNARNQVDPNALSLTKEEDRPKIDFLLRQSKLLGKDQA